MKKVFVFLLSISLFDNLLFGNKHTYTTIL